MLGRLAVAARVLCIRAAASPQHAVAVFVLPLLWGVAGHVWVLLFELMWAGGC